MLVRMSFTIMMAIFGAGLICSLCSVAGQHTPICH